MLPEAVKEGMFPFLVHMGRKTLAFADGEIPEDVAAQMRTFVWITIPPAPVPETFTSLNEAWSYMDTMANYVGAFSYGDRKFAIQARSGASDFATALQNVLLETVAEAHIRSQHDQRQYRALLMHQRTLQVMLDAAVVGPGDETIYDLFTADFEYILFECEAILEQEQSHEALSSSPGSGPPSPKDARPGPWCATLGLLAPLFFVATRCRVPSLRHRAIKALHLSQRREREWNSCVATMLARFVVKTESQHAHSAGALSSLTSCTNGTIPEQYRICLERVEFDREEGTIRIEYMQPRTGMRGFGALQRQSDAGGGIDDDFECIMLPRRRLLMSGYCGIMLVTPPIVCQCGSENCS
jgi:hypothetical protein